MGAVVDSAIWRSGIVTVTFCYRSHLHRALFSKKGSAILRAWKFMNERRQPIAEVLFNKHGTDRLHLYI
jgi:hypothetical protein